MVVTWTTAILFPVDNRHLEKKPKQKEKYLWHQLNKGRLEYPLSVPVTWVTQHELFFQANWFRAAQYCRFHGMHLASISSQEENDKLEKHIKEFGKSNSIPTPRSQLELSAKNHNRKTDKTTTTIVLQNALLTTVWPHINNYDRALNQLNNQP